MKQLFLTRHNLWFGVFILIISYSCISKKHTTYSGISANLYTTNLTADELFIADSIIQQGLDREALYTLLSDIKPMSSLVVFSYPVATQDSILKMSEHVVSQEKQERHLTRLQQIQMTLNKLNLSDLEFILVPYRHVRSNDLLIQLSVVRKSSLDKLLDRKKSFFGQFGLVPGSDANLVLSTIENADTYQRYRGYGYLFGYPDYAVDFFVEASAKSKTNDELEPRNFFQIPAFKGEGGYFVYAYPKDHQPTAEIDSVVYHKAAKVLEEYKVIRPDYVKHDSTLNAYQLLKDTKTILPSK